MSHDIATSLRNIAQELKHEDDLKVRNTLIWLIGLVGMGALSIVVARLTQDSDKVLSDFLVNMSAGFISAAVLTLVIDRAYMNRQGTREKQSALLRQMQTIILLQQRVQQMLEQNDKNFETIESLDNEIQKKEIIVRNWNSRHGEDAESRLKAQEDLMPILEEIQHLLTERGKNLQDNLSHYEVIIHFQEIAQAKIAEIHNERYRESELRNPKWVEESYATVVSANRWIKEMKAKNEQHFPHMGKNMQALEANSKRLAENKAQLVEIRARLSSISNKAT